MAGTHARLSASSAERFMSCPGSVMLSELLPPEEESEFAAEGTAAHKLAEWCLVNGTDAFMYMGQVIDGFTVDKGMVDAVQVYVDYIREIAVDDLLIEHVLDNTGLGPDFGGTSDAVVNGIVDGGGYIHVNDYKHGFLPVNVQYEDGSLNKQLMYYAFGVLRGLGVQLGDKVSVCLTIIQPRAMHKDGPIREVWTDSDEILAWAENYLIPAMEKVNTDDTLDFGEHCRFCPAKVACPRLIENFEGFLNMDPNDIPGFSNDELAERFAQIATVKMHIKALEAECKKRALQDNAVAGTKLIYGRSTRKWKEGAEIDLVAEFGEDIYTEPELKSPAQIEELPGGGAFTGRLAYKEKGRPSLVASDADGEPYDVKKEGEGFAKVPAA